MCNITTAQSIECLPVYRMSCNLGISKMHNPIYRMFKFLESVEDIYEPVGKQSWDIPVGHKSKWTGTKYYNQSRVFDKLIWCTIGPRASYLTLHSYLFLAIWCC